MMVFKERVLLVFQVAKMSTMMTTMESIMENTMMKKATMGSTTMTIMMTTMENITVNTVQSMEISMAQSMGNHMARKTPGVVLLLAHSSHPSKDRIRTLLISMKRDQVKEADKVVLLARDKWVEVPKVSRNLPKEGVHRASNSLPKEEVQ
jgi:hypothetical protein